MAAIIALVSPEEQVFEEGPGDPGPGPRASASAAASRTWRASSVVGSRLFATMNPSIALMASSESSRRS